MEGGWGGGIGRGRNEWGRGVNAGGVGGEVERGWARLMVEAMAVMIRFGGWRRGWERGWNRGYERERMEKAMEQRICDGICDGIRRQLSSKGEVCEEPDRR